MNRRSLKHDIIEYCTMSHKRNIGRKNPLFCLKMTKKYYIEFNNRKINMFVLIKEHNQIFKKRKK